MDKREYLNEYVLTRKDGTQVLFKKGEKFNRLTVDSVYIDLNIGKVYCDCTCECTNKKNHIVISSLISGNTKSCGCLNKELTIERNTKHGQAKRGKKTRLYEIWNSMRKRCDNPNTASSKGYYDKGIKYCDEWNEFSIFQKWAEENGYDENLTLERKDNSKGYNPDNCCWIPKSEQSKNRTTNHYITYNGETHTLTDWAKIRNINRSTLTKRLKNGWSISESLEFN